MHYHSSHARESQQFEKVQGKAINKQIGCFLLSPASFFPPPVSLKLIYIFSMSVMLQERTRVFNKGANDDDGNKRLICTNIRLKNKKFELLSALDFYCAFLSFHAY